jgi:hypothetical protein
MSWLFTSSFALFSMGVAHRWCISPFQGLHLVEEICFGWQSIPGGDVD